jgi:hypothetical protein
MLKRSYFLAAVLAAATASCGASSSHAHGKWTTLPSGEQVELVTVRLEDVMIAPAKSDGRQWDVATPIDEPNARAQVVAAMDHAPDPKRAYEAALAAIARLGDAWGRPDIAGKVSLDQADGTEEKRTFEGPIDTFTPRLGVTWTHVPLSHWTTMHMYLVEKDPGGTEDVGAVVLSAHDLARAFEQHGRVHHVRVDDQTNGQVLYVGIVVLREE